MAETKQLGDTVRGIGQLFEMVDDQLMMRMDSFHQACLIVDGLSPEQREPVASDLLAMSVALREKDPLHCEQAVLQIFVLATLVLEDNAAAQALFATENIDLNAAKKLLDNRTQTRPVGTSPLTQGQNMFALLKDN